MTLKTSLPPWLLMLPPGRQRSVAASSSSQALSAVPQIWQRVRQRHVASKCHKLRTQIGFVAAPACSAASLQSSVFTLQSPVCCLPPPLSTLPSRSLPRHAYAYQSIVWPANWSAGGGVLDAEGGSVLAIKRGLVDQKCLPAAN